MGITIGDVLSVISTILAICISSWALIICVAYLFGAKSGTAQASIERKPWRTGILGLLFLAPSGFLAIAFAASPLPLLKLVGLIGAFMLVVIAAIGASALASLVAERMVNQDPRIQHNQAIGRAAGLLIAACVMPVIGWFILSPILLTLCIGAGITSLLARSSEKTVCADLGGS